MEILNGYIRYFRNGKEYDGSFSPGKRAEFSGLAAEIDIKTVSGGFSVRLTLHPEGKVQLRGLVLHARHSFSVDDRIFCNGYQSWTDSREFGVAEELRGMRSVMRLVKMQRYGDINFFPYSGKHGEYHSHTYCYIRRGERFTLAGSLGEQEGYTIFKFTTGEGRIDIIKDCDGLSIDRNLPVMDLFIGDGNEQEVFERYFGMAKFRRLKTPPATGWTSWYNYYTNITQDIILNNAKRLAGNKIPLDFVQIDDGFQTAVGDWFSIKPEFPGGMKHLADEIHRLGFRAGLWLAPFICEKKSDLAMKRRSWLVTDKNGRPVVAGWNPGWSGDFYALDIYNPHAREYIENVFVTVLREWGYDMVKLDFLYAAAVIPRAGKSRGAIMSDAMKLLRDCVKSKKILGCGVPLGPAFGQVDYCRIGSDVALKWEDRLLSFMRYRERVDTNNSLTSTIGRRHLSGNAFQNDPDVFILRGENNSLSPEEKTTLFVLNNIFGRLVFTSDDISAYSATTMNLYRSMFPLREKSIWSVRDDNGLHTIHFSIGPLKYVAYANLSGTEAGFTLQNGVLYRADPSSSEGHFIIGGVNYTLAAHDTHCFLRLAGGAPSIAGSTGHIFPGSEVSSLRASGRRFAMKLHSAARRPCDIMIRVARPGRYYINGAAVTSEAVLPETHVIKITME